MSSRRRSARSSSVAASLSRRSRPRGAGPSLSRWARPSAIILRRRSRRAHHSRMADPSDSAQTHADTIADLHHTTDLSAGRHQQLIDGLTRRLGRPRTLYACVAMLSAWIIVTPVASRLDFEPPDPPPFHGLQAVVTLAGLLLTTIVLITQNRQLHRAARRAQLQLYVTLL